MERERELNREGERAGWREIRERERERERNTHTHTNTHGARWTNKKLQRITSFFFFFKDFSHLYFKSCNATCSLIETDNSSNSKYLFHTDFFYFM